MKTALATLFLGLLATPSIAADGAVWYDDFDKAVAAAKEQKKDLFVDFTGSDWCGWCIRLHNEVFDHEEFLTAAQEKYVLVALDFPSGEEAKAKVPNPERNEELQAKYNIQGFPTILMMTVDGEVYAQTGYQRGGPKAYVEHMEEIATSGKKALVEVKEVITAFEAAAGEEKVKAWERVATTLKELDEGSPFATPLAEAVRWAMEFDADNAKGLKLRAVETLITRGIFDDGLYEAGTTLDPKNEKGLYEKVVDGRFNQVNDEKSALAALAALEVLSTMEFKDNKIAFSLNFRAAMWSNGPLNDAEAAKKYAQAAKEIGSEDQQLLDEIEKVLNA